MKKTISTILLYILFIGCSIKQDPFVLENDRGLLIKISNLKYNKSQKKMIGYVKIENKQSDFIKFSNQELFLFYGNDSARTFMNMPGVWEIDNGLINITAGKTLTYKACWHIDNYNKNLTFNMKYTEILPRN